MSYQVLIVDDSPIVRAMVKKNIKISGLDVGEIFEAGNGVEALEVLRDEWIDIVLADLNMPEMSGEELIVEMSQDSVLVSVPVVVISSDQNEERIALLKDRGIRAYMKKPFRPEEFRDVVSDVLDTLKEA